jgi:Cu(I)/Ag(I) efflux system membrane fusion protein
MWRAVVVTAATALVATFGQTVFSQVKPTKPDAKQSLRAFEYYEGVRVALTAGNLQQVGAPAKQLAAIVERVGGTDTKRAANALASETTLAGARKQFGELSVTLVPMFQEHQLPGVYAFMCPMAKKSWVQRGNKIENPYFGDEMLTCGVPLKAKAK